MFAPLNIVSGSYSQVFFQRISEIENPHQLQKLYFKALIQFLILASIMVLFVWILPDNTMGLIFGDAWIDSIQYLRMLSFWYALNFVTSSLSFIVLRIQMQRIGLVLDALHFVIIFGSIIAAHYYHCSEIEAVKWLVIAKVLYFAINILTIQWQLHRYVNKFRPS
jgi:O-antigen/teichoic acid export membrane protein